MSKFLGILSWKNREKYISSIFLKAEHTRNKFLNALVCDPIYTSQGQKAAWQLSHTSFWAGILYWILSLFLITLTRELPNYQFMLYFVDTVFKNNFKYVNAGLQYSWTVTFFFSFLFLWGIRKHIWSQFQKVVLLTCKSHSRDRPYGNWNDPGYTVESRRGNVFLCFHLNTLK